MRKTGIALALVLGVGIASPAVAETYPIIAFGSRTYVAETTRSGGTVLVRVYQRRTSSTYRRFGGFTVPASKFAARRAEVRRNPEDASAVERVYFTGRIIGETWFQPSNPLYREPRFKIRK